MRLCAVCPPRVAWMQQQNTQSDRGSFTPARRCASYVLRCLVPTSFAGAQRIILLSGSASFFSVVRPSLVRAAHTRGGGNVRDVVLRRTSQSPCLVDSERPMTVHPVMGKTPSQIGQTSLSVLSTWVQYPPPAWMTRLCLVVRLSRVMSHAHNVVRFPFFERVSRLDVRITDHGHVVGVRLVCLLVPGLAHSMLHTHRLRVARASPTRTKHPVRSDKHLFPWHRGHPSRTWDVPHLPWTCSCHLSSREAWVFSLTSMPITFTVRLLSSSLVFSRLLSSSWVGSSASVSPRECPSSCVTRTLGCSSESVPASTGQQLIHAHLLHD